MKNFKVSLLSYGVITRQLFFFCFLKADIGDDADSSNRSKRRRTDQDPSSSNRAVEEGNVSDHEGEIEDHLRRRALDSLRRKKAGGGTGSESA